MNTIELVFLTVAIMFAMLLIASATIDKISGDIFSCLRINGMFNGYTPLGYVIPMFKCIINVLLAINFIGVLIIVAMIAIVEWYVLLYRKLLLRLFIKDVDFSTIPTMKWSK